VIYNFHIKIYIIKRSFISIVLKFIFCEEEFNNLIHRFGLGIWGES
jgi:hypothetical protein